MMLALDLGDLRAIPTWVGKSLRSSMSYGELVGDFQVQFLCVILPRLWRLERALKRTVVGIDPALRDERDSGKINVIAPCLAFGANPLDLVSLTVWR